MLAHFLHAGRRHDLDAEIEREVEFDLAIIELALAQHLSEFFTGARILIAGLGLFAPDPHALRTRQQGIEHALFGIGLCLRTHAQLGLFTHLLDGMVHQVADDGFDVLADITDLGELGGFHLDEGRVGQLRKAARDFGLADAGRADHQDIFRCHLVAHGRVQLHAPPAVAQRDRDRALGLILTNDVLVQFEDDLTWRKFGHGTFHWCWRISRCVPVTRFQARERSSRSPCGPFRFPSL